jgi:hypothetical protein
MMAPISFFGGLSQLDWTVQNTVWVMNVFLGENSRSYTNGGDTCGIVTLLSTVLWVPSPCLCSG